MKQIIPPHGATLNILGKPLPARGALRLMSCCLPLETEHGVLLFHLLTRELLLLTGEEYAAHLTSPYLREHWFVVPEETVDREQADLVRWVRRSLRKEPEHTTGYTILTTTDCNARCFYCYEKGCRKVTMSQETAHKAAGYIISHCGGKPVSLSWFGGEPLMNVPVIDTIVEDLRAAGVSFSSKMVSNGYLFTEALARRAKEHWLLKSVQITIDGTEPVYNRSKAYVYRKGSPYQVVMGNIRSLLEAGVSVVVRINMDLHNIGDLDALTDELARQFRGRKGFRVYPHLIFDTQTSWEEQHTPEEWTLLYDALHALESKLEELGFGVSGNRSLSRELRLTHCMADNGSSVVLLPDGRLGLCEHYTDSEYIGSIDSDDRDAEVISRWRETREPIPECDGCFYYPECLRLKRCNAYSECSPLIRADHLRKTQRSMLLEYRRWLKGAAAKRETSQN